MFCNFNHNLFKFLVLICCVFFISKIGNAQSSYLKPGIFETDGNRIYLQDPEVSLETIEGWKGIHAPDRKITLHMQGKEDVIKEGLSTYKFRPTFSIRTIQKPSAIDKKRKQEFLAEITKQYTEVRPHKDFQIIDSVDYTIKDTNDAFVVFSSYVSAGLDIIQIQALVSSATQQFVLSYTDLDNFFRKDELRSQVPWKMIGSLDYVGSPSLRYAGLQFYGGLFFMLVLFFVFRLIIVRRKNRLELKRFLRTRISLKNRVKYFTDKKKAKKIKSIQRLDGVDSLENIASSCVSFV